MLQSTGIWIISLTLRLCQTTFAFQWEELKISMWTVHRKWFCKPDPEGPKIWTRPITCEMNTCYSHGIKAIWDFFFQTTMFASTQGPYLKINLFLIWHSTLLEFSSIGSRSISKKKKKTNTSHLSWCKYDKKEDANVSAQDNERKSQQTAARRGSGRWTLLVLPWQRQCHEECRKGKCKKHWKWCFGKPTPYRGGLSAWIWERTGPGSVHVRGPCGWRNIPQVSSVLWTRAEMPGAQLLNALRRERSVHHRISRSGGWCHNCPSPLQRLLWSPKEFMKPSSWLDSIKPPRKDSTLDSHYSGCSESALTPLGFPRLHSSGSLLTLLFSRQLHVTWV